MSTTPGLDASEASRTLVCPNGGPLLDARGAAGLLNMPASWVLAEARADRIPHVRLGRYVRFEAGELELWWRRRRRGPGGRTGFGPISPGGNGP
jgi:hypothetical protein